MSVAKNHIKRQYRTNYFTLPRKVLYKEDS